MAEVAGCPACALDLDHRHGDLAPEAVDWHMEEEAARADMAVYEGELLQPCSFLAWVGRLTDPT